MTFRSPEWLYLLLAVPVLVAVYAVVYARRSQAASRFAEPALFSGLLPGRPRLRRHVPAAALLLGITASLVAFAEPVSSVTTRRDAAALVVVMDTSNSMKRDDIRPTRLVAATRAADRFVADLPEHVDVGVVSFAASATVLIPPTDNHRAARAALKGFDHSRGTAIGEGVHSGVTALRDALRIRPDRPAAERENQVPLRLVVLSDGVNTTGRPVAAAAQEAVELGAVVDTIAFAIDDPTRRGVGGFTGHETLSSLARATGGRFFDADTTSELREVYQRIGRASVLQERPRPITDWFLGLAFLSTLGAGWAALTWFRRLPL